MRIAPLRQYLPVVVAIMLAISVAPALAEHLNLTDRTSPKPQTTNNVPHFQIGVEPVPEISAELLSRVSNIPGLEIGGTTFGIPGAQGFWVSDDIKKARNVVIAREREFAHMHSDGSLHAYLSPERGNEAVATGWAIQHPWANQRQGWEGYVMIYTPQTGAELDVVFGLVEESFNFVTGQNHSAPDN